MAEIPPVPASGRPYPATCDVLVIGAGPAGSACAQVLAAGGVDVLLADQHDFPRDKVCGDGLIPDSHAALRRLGVYDEVADRATHVRHVRCIGPRGGHVDVPGTLSVLPRKVLDEVLVRAAVRAGARLLTPWRFESPLTEAGRVVGGRFATARGAHEVEARWTVLATGAVPRALIAAGLCERHTPSGIALRGYVRHEGLVDRIRQLQVVWHPRLRGGYGWIFPAPGGVFNIGVGLTDSHVVQRSGKGRMQGVNLKSLLEHFGAVHAPAGELLRDGQALGNPKGAPLRCSLSGARWSRPGLLATGEAAGSTYAFTGEGIGKALETGLLAAESLLQGPRDDDEALRRGYESRLQALRPRFQLYETGGRVNRHPWLADVVVWRARRSPRILQRLSGLLEETHTPGHLFTLRGLQRLLLD
jgi:geranylgeranyl reductase family protein